MSVPNPSSEWALQTWGGIPWGANYGSTGGGNISFGSVAIVSAEAWPQAGIQGGYNPDPLPVVFMNYLAQ